MSASATRQGHAVLDLVSRQWKGRKIERLLGLGESTQVRRLLEVGTGSGGIAHFFASQASPTFDVDAVDVTDARQVVEGYRFTLVPSALLPFESESFDVVLTNHVIEHVGDSSDQMTHLREIRRVLKADGLVYLAVPNRWMLVEPHYKLPFLSWLPRKLRSTYVRWSGRGTHYDCEPLERGELEIMTGRAGFDARNISVEAFRATLAIEGNKGTIASIVARMPDTWLQKLEAIIPTHIYLLRKSS
ncbi:class I SAM-dependent methyltransferase [Pinirhizobacter soli]|uniref:class I SAM-dependent methyltransferase n=1 Tax=Pinirhizobacter soli TaxID=2786953 RepID=UPI002029DAB1